MGQFQPVVIIGGGLAGCEAAWQLACRGVPVRLVEMRPIVGTPVHHGDGLAELVCSNSLKSLDPASAAGLLKSELVMLGSFVLSCAYTARVPAGGALAVDRDVFSTLVTDRIEAHPLITLERREAVEVPSGRVIVATGPLTSDALTVALSAVLGETRLAFYDAAAPIVDATSLDRDVLFAQSRYDKGDTADYLNAPFEREEYERFISELISAQRVITRQFERRELFTACQPVEEVARTGVDALRYGALKPVGLTNPVTGRRPWAAVQLRTENAAATAYNLVGFQTNLTWPEQRRVFSMIPGLERVEFLRYGVMHRNTFIDAPHTLDRTFAIPGSPEIRFAGQVTGTEGYCEAIASGLYAGLCTYADIARVPVPYLPVQSAFGALVAYATDPHTENYQPMHVNFGLMQPLEVRIKGKRERYAAYTQRAQMALDDAISVWENKGSLRMLPFEEPVDGIPCIDGGTS